MARRKKTDVEAEETKVVELSEIVSSAIEDENPKVEIDQKFVDELADSINASQIMDNILDSFSLPLMVDPSVTLIHENDPFKKIELAGRTCYKSEDKITKGSAKKFYEMLKDRKHYAMIEHANMAFIIDCEDGAEDELMDYIQFIQKSEFLRVTFEPDIPRIIVSGNIRAILEREVIDPVYKALISKYPEFIYGEGDSEENSKDDEPVVSSIYDATYYNVKASIVDLRKLKNLTKDEFMNHFYFTIKFITDRGVTHEIVRHRKFSFAQESTRYCNYSKDKFENKITYCKPSTYDSWTLDQQDTFNTALSAIESVYMYLVSSKDSPLQPQQARAVLPNSVKSEIVVSGPAYEWDHFFNLRSKGTTGAPHPDMKKVADIALQKVNKYIRSLKFENDLRF